MFIVKAIRESIVYLDHRVRFINGLEVGIRSVITKLHKTLSFGGKTYIKEKYTKLYQEILCKTVKFIVFSRFSYKTLLQLKVQNFKLVWNKNDQHH